MEQIKKLIIAILENYEVKNISGDEAIGRLSVFIPQLLTHIKDLEAENKRLEDALRVFVDSDCGHDVKHLDEFCSVCYRIAFAAADDALSKDSE